MKPAYQIIALVLLALSLCFVSCSNEDAPQRLKKVRVHKMVYSAVNGYIPLQTVELRYVDSLYRGGDLVKLYCNEDKTNAVYQIDTLQN